ncbi:hypothetical protein, partial [Caldisphaera sp.]|uniref:hypothetical protein n=1 Tax=Caldisphaera sp. TaxID=2060322 RepID=UPI003D0F7C32
GFKEIEPGYYTKCEMWNDYFIFINPIANKYMIYTKEKDENGYYYTKILLDTNDVEDLYHAIDGMFDIAYDYFNSECYLNTKYLYEYWKHNEPYSFYP